MRSAKPPLPRTLLLLVVLLAVSAAAFWKPSAQEPRPKELQTGEFIALIAKGRINFARWTNETTIIGSLGAEDGNAPYTVTVPSMSSPAGSDIAKQLDLANVDWTYDAPSLRGDRHITPILPLITFILGGLVVYFLTARRGLAAKVLKYPTG